MVRLPQLEESNVDQVGLKSKQDFLFEMAKEQNNIDRSCLLCSRVLGYEKGQRTDFGR